MRYISITLAACRLLSAVDAAACPMRFLNRAGLLNVDEVVKYDTAARDVDLAKSHGILQTLDERGESSIIGLRMLMALWISPSVLGFVGPKAVNKDRINIIIVNGALQKLSRPLAELDIPTPQPPGLKKIPGDDPDHQFEAPGPSDVRGICPTLNAFANHRYIDRSGIISFAEATNAVQTGYGFTYGKYSIGGADDRVPDTLGPTLGLDKHGVFEIDGSITREEVNFGNNENFILERWEQYVEISKKHGGFFNQPTQAEDNGLRYDNSRATNPKFFAGAIWFAVSHAERVADYANVAPFFLNETFPQDWFRRGDPFTLPSAFAEAIDMALINPRVLGSNQGQIGCFVLENIFDLAPCQLHSAVANHLNLWQAFVKGAVAPFFVNDGFFNCDVRHFVKPSPNAGVDQSGSKSSSGSPVNGAYLGIGVIKPDH